MPTTIPRKPSCDTKPSRHFLTLQQQIAMKKKKVAELEKKMIERRVRADRTKRWVMEISLNRQNNEEMERLEALVGRLVTSAE